MKQASWFGVLAILLPTTAHAFCGFYVNGGGAKLFNNATQVVLMRDAKTTVLSMQNNYEGPPEDFALVIPVPVVLKEKDVKTLPEEVFTRIDQMDAPRLVEYWEQNPCQSPLGEDKKDLLDTNDATRNPFKPIKKNKDSGVTIEAKFNVGEYQIVILSARDSTGLDSWLRDNGYNIPKGAEPVLRPYVESGMKFFVAKVNVKKVKFKDNQAMLSPLRFHYDSKEFALPVRLGLLNSSGTQDLIVHILAKDRYETSNYKNVTIPTNINVAEGVKEEFGPFYAALFDKTIEKNPGAVVTEYAWAASSCDPCPIPPLSAADLATLGADILPGTNGFVKTQNEWNVQGYFVLTRLHARYTKDSLGEDLVFQKAEPIVGGREFVQTDGKLEEGSVTSSINNFQGRYAIRHPWEGSIDCENPKRGIWGGPPGKSWRSTPPKPAMDLAFIKRGDVKLASLVKQDVPEIGLIQENSPDVVSKTTKNKTPDTNASSIPKTKDTTAPNTPETQKGCAIEAISSQGSGSLVLLFLSFFAIFLLRRRSRSNTSPKR